MSQIGKPPCEDALILLGGQATPCATSSRRWVLVAAILGSSMAFLDGTVVNVALPAIQQDLHATASDAQWVVESYALFLAALLVLGGSLGDHFGRRRIFLIGVALFTLASVGCALSTDVDHLIVARGVQGAGAALLVPGSLALISAHFPQKERGRAIGTWSGFSGITAALGPVLGGFLIDHYSWAWAFLINVPLGLAVLAIAWFGVPESRGASANSALDPWGAIFATAALGGVVYAFIEAPTLRWDSRAVLTALCIGTAAAVGFVVAEFRARSPMLPLRLFRNRTFSGANLLTLLLYAALGGALFFFPLNLIQVQGYPASAAGAALLPFILIMFGLSPWAGSLVDRLGARLPLVAGPLIAALGFALFTLPDFAEPSRYWSTFFPAIAVLGFGMTITVAPLTTTVMNSVGPEMAGIASGVNNAVSRTAALLAIAVFGMVMASAFDANMDRRLRELNVPGEVRALLQSQRSKLAGAEVPRDTKDAATLERVVKGSYVFGFRWVMLLSAVLALLSAFTAWVSIGRRRVS